MAGIWIFKLARGKRITSLAVPDAETQLEWRAKLVGAGLRVSPVMDRNYFKSIYTNDPVGFCPTRNRSLLDYR